MIKQKTIKIPFWFGLRKWRRNPRKHYLVSCFALYFLHLHFVPYFRGNKFCLLWSVRILPLLSTRKITFEGWRDLKNKTVDEYFAKDVLYV